MKKILSRVWHGKTGAVDSSASVILSFIGRVPETEITMRYGLFANEYGTTERPAVFLAELIAQIVEQSTLQIFTGDAVSEEDQKVIRQRLGSAPQPVPTGSSPEDLWEAFDKITDAVPHSSNVLIDISLADKTQAMLALTAAAYLRTAHDIGVRAIIDLPSSPDSTGTYVAREVTPFLEFIDWSNATEQFLRYGNALPLRDRLYDVSFTTRIEHDALTGLATKLQDLSESLALLRPVETLDKAIGIRKAVARLQAIVHELPEAKPIEPLLSRIQARFEPFSEAGKLTEPSGFAALAHMIEVYLQTDHYVEAITLAREALVTRVCADEGWHGLHDRRRAEDKLNALAYESKQSETQEGDDATLGDLWLRLGDLRNDISHAGFRRYPTYSSTAAENVKRYCGEAVERLLA